MIQLTTKNKVIIVAVYTVTAIAVGRWSLPATVKTEIKTVTVEKLVENKETNKDTEKHKKVVVHEVDKPTGEKDITTTTTDDDKEKTVTDDAKTTDVAKTTDNLKEVTRSQDKVTLSMLGGYDLYHSQFVYGASVSKPILGPITLGAWGLNNGTVGASLGLTF